ncbi:MAG: SCO family protein [Pseudomonadota bacterium]
MKLLGILASIVLLIAAGVAGLIYNGVIKFDESMFSQASIKSSVGGPFELTDQNGQTFSSQQLDGKPFLVFFGFTHCPDVCPTTLNEVANHLDDEKVKASGLRAVFISVDPERDKPEQMKDYVASFNPEIVALTGTEEQIADVAKKYRAYYAKVPQDDDYTMDHSALVYLMDANGQYAGSFNFQEDEKSRTAKLHRLVGASS